MENNFQYISAAITDRGLSEKRPQNEDSYLEINKSGLFAVADGVGGAQAGDVASSMAMEILGEAFVNMRAGGDAEDIMKLGIERANSAIFQMSQDLPQLATMATTIVALHLSGNIATIGHVGDSRLYRLDSNGSLYRETNDHSVVEEEVRAGRMTPEQAENHPSKNIISRALGAEPFVEVDLKTIMVEANNSFLLCSDGITRHISDNEIREMLASGLPPDEICEQMKFVCYERGAEDNLTAVVIRISSEIGAKNAGTNKPFTAESEEATVATSRPPLVNTAVFSKQLFDDDDEAPTQNLQMSDAMRQHSDQQTYQPNYEQNNVGAPENQTYENTGENYQTSPSVAPVTAAAIPVQNTFDAPTATPPETAASAEHREITRQNIFETQEEEPAKSGFFGKLFGGLLLLIVGAVIGAGLHYLFAQSAEPVGVPQPITQMQSKNITFTAFEENRRNVDNNPQGYITANNLKVPEGAEDLYLLGRAHLLTKQYAEARKSLIEARNKLAQAPPENNKILATEIAMALAIIDTPLSQRSFEQDVSAANPQTNANSANSANTVNSNR